MNPAADFFRRHGAIPVTPSGPAWRDADDISLLAWFRADRAVAVHGWHLDAGREATPAERARTLPRYNELAAEVARRARLPGASAALVGAAFAAGLMTS